MAFGSSSEVAAAIAGWRIGRRGHCGMEVERDHAWLSAGRGGSVLTRRARAAVRSPASERLLRWRLRAPGKARCSSRESCGAGAITELCPMLRSPRRRVESAATAGGGAITARSIRGARREISDAGTTGAGRIGICGLPGIFSNRETTFGIATSR